MAAKILVKDGKKYGGKYVATKSFKHTDVLCSGTDPLMVIEEAKKKGAKNPVLIYVAEKGVVHIY
jgi:hypothetical protein